MALGVNGTGLLLVTAIIWEEKLDKVWQTFIDAEIK